MSASLPPFVPMASHYTHCLHLFSPVLVMEVSLDHRLRVVPFIFTAE